MDPEFGLADKIWLKDKAKKPHTTDLTSRASKLLNFLSRFVKKRKPVRVEEKKKKKKDVKKDKEKDDKKKKHKKDHRDKKHKRISEIQNDRVNSPASPQKASTSKEKVTLPFIINLYTFRSKWINPRS